jgi:hypothetical protein
MYEYGTVWELIGPDGTTITFNNGDGVFLEDITGFDMPSVRTNIEERPEDDGAVAGAFYFGARSVTMRGRVQKASAAERNAWVMSLQRAARGLRSSVTLRATPSGGPPMQVTGRLEQPLRVTGAYVKEWQLAFVCPDPYIYSQTLNTQTSMGGGTVPGAAFPLVFPIAFGAGVYTSLDMLVTNAGNVDAPLTIRIYGPLVNPQIQNNTTGEALWVDATLASGEYVTLNTGARTATLQDGSNAYHLVRFPDSAWWKLVPGVNDLRVFASSQGAGSQLTVEWRDAWV